MLQETSRIELTRSFPSSITMTILGFQTSNAQTKIYHVILQQDEDGRFIVTCPDLPGVVTDGADEKEAMQNAGYAVSDMLDYLGIPNKEFNLSQVLTF